MLMAQPLQPARQILIDDDRHAGSGKRLLRRPRPVGRQRQTGRGTRQTVAPILRLGLQPFPRQPLPLPGGIIRILDRQRRQRIGAPGRKRPVKAAELTHQNPHRPAIGDDVVLRQQKDVVVIGQPDQAAADQRAARKIERCPCFFFAQGRKQDLGIRFTPKVVFDHRQSRVR